MDSSGGWVISKTNFSTGRCSLSKITTTTFSTSFCKDRNPLFQNRVTHHYPHLPALGRMGRIHAQPCSASRLRVPESPEGLKSSSRHTP